MPPEPRGATISKGPMREPGFMESSEKLGAWWCVCGSAGAGLVMRHGRR
jgi:hypothetical protein